MQVINTGVAVGIVLTPAEAQRLSADLVRAGACLQSDVHEDDDYATGDRLEQLGVELELSEKEDLPSRPYEDVPGR